MAVERVDGQIVGVHVETAEHLVERHLLAILDAAGLISIFVQRLFNEFEQMLLVHTCGGVDMRVDFPAIVKVAVRTLFLRLFLLLLATQISTNPIDSRSPMRR